MLDFYLLPFIPNIYYIYYIASEQELLQPAEEASASYRDDQMVYTADADYHSEANLKALAEAAIDAYIPDNDQRTRDERYAGQQVVAV